MLEKNLRLNVWEFGVYEEMGLAILSVKPTRILAGFIVMQL